MLEFCQNRIFGQKFDFSNSVTFKSFFIHFEAHISITWAIFCIVSWLQDVHICTWPEEVAVTPFQGLPDQANSAILAFQVIRNVHGETLSTAKRDQKITFKNLIQNYSITVFENHRKSLIQHCERSELRLHLEWTKVN